MFSVYELMNEILVYRTVLNVPRLSISIFTRETHRPIQRFVIILTYQAVIIARGNEGGPKMLMNVDKLTYNHSPASFCQPTGSPASS